MIHVLITVKESERFPGKNRLLWGYTQAWLAQELQCINEPATVWVVGDESRFLDLVPERWRMLPLARPDHGELQQAAEDAIVSECGAEDDWGPAVFVLCQLTNPLRRRELLWDCVRTARSSGTAVSYSLVPATRWREDAVHSVFDGGAPRELHGQLFCDVARTAPSHVPCLDGCIFAWTRGHCEDSRRFSGDMRRVFNRDGAICDIDISKDLPGGLELEWARLVLEAPGETVGQWQREQEELAAKLCNKSTL